MGRVFTFLFLLSAFQLAEVMSSAEKSFKDHKIVPEIIPVAPTDLLKIQYPSGAEVLEGNELTPTQVKDQPKVSWTVDPKAFYTLCLTDPDAPSRAKPVSREWHHWLVTNIPGGDLAAGDVLTEYVGSGPPKDTGLHRYIFLLYKQPKKIEFSESKLTNKSGDGRGKFSVSKFAEKYSLGNPIAGNFYQAGFDDYVPILHKQLGL